MAAWAGIGSEKHLHSLHASKFHKIPKKTKIFVYGKIFKNPSIFLWGKNQSQRMSSPLWMHLMKFWSTRNASGYRSWNFRGDAYHRETRRLCVCRNVKQGAWWRGGGIWWYGVTCVVAGGFLALDFQMNLFFVGRWRWVYINIWLKTL